MGKLRVDAQLPRAWLGEEEIEVTQREWALLLSLLVANAGQVVSREDVLAPGKASPVMAVAVWRPMRWKSTCTRLRRKLADLV